MKFDDNSDISKTSMKDNKTFKKLCQLASFGLFKAANDIEEAGVGVIFNQDELKLIEYQVSRLEDIFAKKLFKDKSSLS